MADFSCWIWKVSFWGFFFFLKERVHHRAARVSSEEPFVRTVQPPGPGLIQNASTQRINIQLFMLRGHREHVWSNPIIWPSVSRKTLTVVPLFFKQTANQTWKIWGLRTTLAFNWAAGRPRIFGKRTILQPVSNLSIISYQERTLFAMCRVFKQKKDEGHSSVQTREESWASGATDPIKAFSPTKVAPVPVSSALLEQQCANEKQPPWWSPAILCWWHLLLHLFFFQTYMFECWR